MNDKELLMVKIYNRKNGMFCTKQNDWNRYGKMFRKLSHAKTHVNHHCRIEYMQWIDCDFVLFYSTGETENIPVIDYVLTLFENNYNKDSKKSYLQHYADEYLYRINEIKKALEGENE